MGRPYWCQDGFLLVADEHGCCLPFGLERRCFLDCQRFSLTHVLQKPELSRWIILATTVLRGAFFCKYECMSRRLPKQ